METISLKEMLDFMDSGNIFSIGFRTCDKKKNTGGEWIEFDEASKYNHQTAAERLSEAHKQKTSKKNPNHFINSTRNIKAHASGRTIKIHIRLVRLFNGKKVL